MTEVEMTTNSQLSGRYRLLVVAGALAFAVVGGCGDAGPGAEATTTASSVALEVTPPAVTIPGVTVPGATVPPVSIPRGTVPGATIPRPRATVPVATTIPVIVAPDTSGPSVTITFDRSYIYDGTLDCPNQTVDFTVTAFDAESPPATIVRVEWFSRQQHADATPLGGGRYRIPRQNFSPAVADRILVKVEAWDAITTGTLETAYVDYVEGAFPPCTPS